MIAALIATTLALGSAAAPAAPLELRAESTTPGARILLRDVLDAGCLAAVAPELLDLDLGRAPSPGVPRVLTRDEIQARLPAASQDALVGPDALRVTSEVESVTPDRLVEAAREALDRHLPQGADREITLERRPFDVAVPRGREGVTLEARPATDRDRGAVLVQVDVRVDGRLQVSVPVSFRVRTFAEVPALARELSRGDLLSIHDLRPTRVETTALAAPLPADPRALAGAVARRALPAGSVPRAQDFEPQVLVKRNDAVTLLFARGRLRAEAFGLARDAGALGDTVRVENLSTKRLLVGRVAGPGLVQMNP